MQKAWLVQLCSLVLHLHLSLLGCLSLTGPVLCCTAHCPT